MKVLFLSSEAAPYVKIGGLGDIGGSLPIELTKKGIEVLQILPHHQSINLDNLETIELFDSFIDYKDEKIPYKVIEISQDGARLLLISGDLINNDPEVYGANDLKKYLFFSLSAIDASSKLKWAPDILHANDWHTAVALQAIKENEKYSDFYCDTASLLSIHNLPYLGQGNDEILEGFGVKKLVKQNIPEWARGLPLPIGIEHADWINTVSKGYFEEVLTEEFGAGVEEFMISKKEKLSGILNGLDTQTWNPEIDPFITKNFSVNELDKRKENKRELQKEPNLEISPEIPLLSVVSRLNYQKGIDLLVDAVEKMEELPFQLIILGTGEPKLEMRLKKLQDKFTDRVKTFIKYDEGFAHRIYAGADMIIIPSRYEPCGLTQMIGMRYGCIPIASNTGGLKDTVIDISEGMENATGFLFERESVAGIKNSIDRAIKDISNYKKWQKLQINGMITDFSWEKSVQEYVDLYNSLNK